MNQSNQHDGTFRVARILGIDVHIDPWIGLPFLFVITQSSERNVHLGIIMVLIIFFCVLLHEYGHALAARSCKVRTRRITLGMLGGVAELEGRTRSPWQDLWITVAGPLVNVVIWALCQLRPLDPSPAFATLTGWLSLTAKWNLYLLWFNLIPAFPMDGGRILHSSLLIGKVRPWSALYITSIVACAAAIGMVAWGLWEWHFKGYSFPIFRLLIGWQVWTAAVARLGYLKQIKNHPEAVPGPGQI